LKEASWGIIGGFYNRIIDSYRTLMGYHEKGKIRNE
jgi:hypothetical protein